MMFPQMPALVDFRDTDNLAPKDVRNSHEESSHLFSAELFNDEPDMRRRHPTVGPCGVAFTAKWQ